MNGVSIGSGFLRKGPVFAAAFLRFNDSAFAARIFLYAYLVFAALRLS
jgi:hypothetical protein